MRLSKPPLGDPPYAYKVTVWDTRRGCCGGIQCMDCGNAFTDNWCYPANLTRNDLTVSVVADNSEDAIAKAIALTGREHGEVKSVAAP